MINDYLIEYEEAMEKGDSKRMRQIERDLASVGMDKMTILVLIDERRKNNGSC